jgi:hypothetical protein
MLKSGRFIADTLYLGPSSEVVEHISDLHILFLQLNLQQTAQCFLAKYKMGTFYADFKNIKKYVLAYSMRNPNVRIPHRHVRRILQILVFSQFYILFYTQISPIFLFLNPLLNTTSASIQAKTTPRSILGNFSYTFFIVACFVNTSPEVTFRIVLVYLH